MTQVKCIALRALCGSYGKRLAGESFVTDSRTAEILMSRGLVERYREPQAAPVPLIPIEELEEKMILSPENKMLTVPENKAAMPHRGWPKGKPRKPRDD